MTEVEYKSEFESTKDTHISSMGELWGVIS